jgi:hypothetical protein
MADHYSSINTTCKLLGVKSSHFGKRRITIENTLNHLCYNNVKEPLNGLSDKFCGVLVF